MEKVKEVAPNGWSSSPEAQAGVDAEWIKRFHDPTLDRLVTEGLTNNAGLKTSATRLRQAQQRAKLVGSDARPQLGVGLNGNRQRANFLGFPGVNGSSIFNTFGVSLDASWELDLWGRIRAAQGAEVAAFEALAWDLRGARASLKAQIAKAYFALCEAQTQSELAQQSRKISEQTRDAIAERFESAITDEGGSGAQYRLAESDMANAQAEVARWEGQADAARKQIELLLGRYPSGNLMSSKALPKVPKAPPVGLPSELLLRRPDILSAERSYAESIQNEKEAALALFPSIRLTSSGGTSTTQLSSILDSSFGIWSLGGALAQSVFTGGLLQAERAIRKQEIKARLIELQDTVLQAFGEVETSLGAERYLLERFKFTNDALRLAEEAAEAARLDYRDGVTSIQDVLNAEGRLTQSASALTTIHRLILENRIDLHLALGGDFTPTSK